MILYMPTVIFIGSVFGKRLHKLYTGAQNQFAKAMDVWKEAIQNIGMVN